MSAYLNVEPPIEPMQLAKLTAGELSAVIAEGAVLSVQKSRNEGKLSKADASNSIAAIFSRVSAQSSEFSVDVKGLMHNRVVAEGFALLNAK